MPNVRFLACLGLFFLGCATTQQAAQGPAASGPETSGRETASARSPDPAPVAALHIRMSVLPGWKQFEAPPLQGAFLGFRNDDAQAVIMAKVIPAGGVFLGAIISERRQEMAERGGACRPTTVAGESYAAARCIERGPNAERSIIAVRRPSGRPDVLLVMTARWPDRQSPAIEDEIDLMFLLASVE